MAFIVAGCVLLITIGWTLLIGLANGMAAAPSSSNRISSRPWLIGGIALSAAVAGSHWLPSVRW